MDNPIVCDLEGYAQMEWVGRFNSKTKFHYFRKDIELGGIIVSEKTTAQQLWKDVNEIDHRNGRLKIDILRDFASDLIHMKKVPTDPQSTLRLMDSYERYYGL